MAIVFELAAECGHDVEQAFALGRCFDGATWPLSDGSSMYYNFSTTHIWQAKSIDNVFWCNVIPSGSGGSTRFIASKPLALRMEATKKLYAHLRNCDGYRFAWIGWEIAGTLRYEELLQGNLSSWPAGLVISRALWLEISSPSALLPFGDHGFWKPFTEHDVDTLRLNHNDV